MHWSSSIAPTFSIQNAQNRSRTHHPCHSPRDVPDRFCQQHLWQGSHYFCWWCLRCHSLQSHNLKLKKWEREGAVKLSLGCQQTQVHSTTQSNGERWIAKAPNHRQPSWGGTWPNYWVKSAVVRRMHDARKLCNPDLYITVCWSNSKPGLGAFFVYQQKPIVDEVYNISMRKDPPSKSQRFPELEEFLEMESNHQFYS